MVEGKGEMKRVSEITEDDLENILLYNDLEAIEKRYSKRELIDMYRLIYSGYPRTAMRKMDIIQAMASHFHTMRRARAFRFI